MKKITATLVFGAMAAAIIGGGVFALKFEDWIKIPKAREPILAQLRDPGSAQFRNEHFGKSGALCGEVNSKNGMGGYTGFEKYFTTGKVSYLENSGSLDVDTTDEFILRMDKKIALLKAYNQIQAEHPNIPAPSEAKIAEQAAREVIRDKFREACGIEI